MNTLQRMYAVDGPHRQTSMYTDNIPNDKLSIDQTATGYLEAPSPTNRSSGWNGRSCHLATCYTMIAVLLGALGIAITKDGWFCSDPSLQLYSPANSAVKYKQVTFNTWFFESSPYTRASKEVKDTHWEALYEFGISGIPKSEADRLVNETLTNPHDPGTYMMQLEVFHNIHCLNMIRKALYPEEYDGLWSHWPNGTVNHKTLQALHWDHCVDALLQSIMCKSDVTPVVFEKNFFGRGVTPKIASTHTCRDFDAVVQWAKAHEVKNYQPL